jgi:hypothetical protein
MIKKIILQLLLTMWYFLYLVLNAKRSTGGPHYMQEIGTQKIGSHITNLHIKRPRVPVNQRIGSRKEAISVYHIRKIEDKKTAHNEGCLYVPHIFN